MVTKKDLEGIQKCMLTLEILIKKYFQNQKIEEVHIVPYGSITNGLATRGNHDLDITIVLPLQIDDPEKRALKEEELLQGLSQWIRKGRADFSQVTCFTASFGPLLQFKHNLTQIDVDLSINKVLDPFNSHLMQVYAKLDTRFHKVALFLKQWNKRNFKNVSGKFNNLNSFSIVLMLIAYLQHIQVLPCLQKLKATKKHIKYFRYLFKNKVYNFGDVITTDIKFQSSFETIQLRFKNQKYQDKSVSELLIGFFDYYGSSFDFKGNAISISMDPPYLSKDVSHINKSYAAHINQRLQKHDKFRDAMIAQMTKCPILLVDPFDWTYNPAKNLKPKNSEEYVK